MERQVSQLARPRLLNNYPNKTAAEITQFQSKKYSGRHQQNNNRKHALLSERPRPRPQSRIQIKVPQSQKKRRSMRNVSNKEMQCLE